MTPTKDHTLHDAWFARTFADDKTGKFRMASVLDLTREAYAAARAQALEDAATVCDDNEFADGAECAQFVRALKGKP
jgi:hypothetical protein